jgi:hypothetical protein
MTTNMNMPSSFFLPVDNFQSAIKAIASSAIIISLTHMATFRVLSTRYSQKKSSQKEAFKASYQFTNLLVNLSFGLYGLYTCVNYSHPETGDGVLLSKWTTVTDQIFHHDSFYLFGAFQVGYNLWSLPVGILYVNESAAMIAHHISVIIICSLSATSEFGFRYHAPVFLGLFEISSVPLAIVNYLKDHHDWTIKNCKGTFDIMKIVFAVMFFGVRIIIGTPHMLHTIVASFWATFLFKWGESEFDSPLLRTWIGFVLVAQTFMAALQYYWAYLIVKAVTRMGNNGNGKKVGVKKSN